MEELEQHDARLVADEGGMNRVVRARHGLFAVNRNDSIIGRSLTVYGQYSELELDLLRQLCQRGDTVVEVGANLGALTVPLARHVGSEGLVLAFEPQPAMHMLLCANVALNSLLNVRCNCAALGAQTGNLGIPEVDYESPANFGSVSLVDSPAGTGVQVYALDDIWTAPSMNLLKIDVEGMEQEVLQGAARTIARCRPLMYIENDRIEKSEALLRYLFELDYALYWHVVPLFESPNYAGNEHNVFGSFGSCNMLAIPGERDANVSGLTPVDDATHHPFAD